jgi:hypothetical protein
VSDELRTIKIAVTINDRDRTGFDTDAVYDAIRRFVADAMEDWNDKHPTLLACEPDVS